MVFLRTRAFIQLARPFNALLASLTVVLGWWLAESPRSGVETLRLLAATICALAFGNILNDFLDRNRDRVNHPNRPLVTGRVSPAEALIFALLMALGSLGLAASVSPLFLVLTVPALALLVAYDLHLKGTVLAGNVVVSALVAYPLLYGGVGGLRSGRLVVPAILAFLVSFFREIIKDLQDFQGDTQTGLRTTSVLKISSLRVLLLGSTIPYTLLLFAPFMAGQFGWVYLMVCVVLSVPLAVTRTVLTLKPLPDYRLVSFICKLELAAGLLALAADQFFCSH